MTTKTKSTTSTKSSPKNDEPFVVVEEIEAEVHANGSVTLKPAEQLEREQAAKRRIDRNRLAKEEWKALKAWNAEDESTRGEKPATPNLDELQGEHDMPGTKKSSSKAKSNGEGRARLGVSYVVDGKIMQMKNRPYTLGYLAFEHSAGIGGNGRMSTSDFRSYLVNEMKIADVNAPFDLVTLGNGKSLEGIVLGSTKTTVVPTSSAKKPEPVKPVGIVPTDTAKSSRARAAKKADTSTKKPAAKKSPAKSTAKSSSPGTREVTPIPKKSTARKSTASAKK